MSEQKKKRRASVSQARAAIWKAAKEIVDPSPTDVTRIWDFFGDACVYCGRELTRSGRLGHIDHANVFGGNQIGNLVLACRRCNGDDKREMDAFDYLEILRGRGIDTSEAERKIAEWASLNPRVDRPTCPEIDLELAAIRDLQDELTRRCDVLRLAVARAATASSSTV